MQIIAIISMNPPSLFVPAYNSFYFQLCAVLAGRAILKQWSQQEADMLTDTKAYLDGFDHVFQRDRVVYIWDGD